MPNVRTSPLHPQVCPKEPPEPERDAASEEAIRHLRRSAERSCSELRGVHPASLSGLPVDAQGRYLVVWPDTPHSRGVLTFEAAGPVEAAALFAVGCGAETPRFFGRTDRVLYAQFKLASGETLRYYVLPASTPEAPAVSSYLAGAEDLDPSVLHGGYTVMDSSPFAHGPRPVVVERRAAVVVEGFPLSYEHRAIFEKGGPLLTGTAAQRVADLLNADFQLAAGSQTPSIEATRSEATRSEAPRGEEDLS